MKEGPVEPSTFTRFADAVDAISRGTTVGRMRRMFLDSSELVLDLDVRANVAGTRPHDHREVAPVEACLGDRASGGRERQARLPPHEAALRLGDADVVVGQLARVYAGDLTTAVHLHGRRIGPEGNAAPLPQHGLERGEVVAHVAQHARPSHHDVAPTRARTVHLD